MIKRVLHAMKLLTALDHILVVHPTGMWAKNFKYGMKSGPIAVGQKAKVTVVIPVIHHLFFFPPLTSCTGLYNWGVGVINSNVFLCKFHFNSHSTILINSWRVRVFLRTGARCLLNMQILDIGLQHMFIFTFYNFCSVSSASAVLNSMPV